MDNQASGSGDIQSSKYSSTKPKVSLERSQDYTKFSGSKAEPIRDSSSESSDEERGGVVAENIPEGRGSSYQASNRIMTDKHGQTSVKYDEEDERMEIDYVDDEDHPFMTPGEEDNDDTSHDNRQQPRGPGREGPQVEEPHGDEQENKEEDEGTVVTVVRDDDDEHQRKAFKSREEEKKK
uniref:histone-lysine N-methyltransferase SETD1B-like isoform X3 n=1 Tax=Styela clava TaxID=7725 RepID=UPI00193A0CEC|nr:histone-lysine N-methyltransferase SETD1B-like isoform X3 [Styela clava]